MRRTTLLLVLAAAAAPLYAQPARQVRQAMDAVRRGDSSRVSAVHKLGASAVPHLKPYVRDGNENVRREAVVLLGLSGSRAAIPPLLEALEDNSADIRQRAARLLYDKFAPNAVAAAPQAAAALQRAACREPLAGALLLLAYVPGPASEKCLDAAREPGFGMVKLREDSLPVPAGVPATMALSRLGRNTARHELIETIARNDLATLRFVFFALREVDAPEVLHALKPALQDTREVPGGVPSGAEPARRLCDEAADALVRRLKLKVSFTPGAHVRYTVEQLDEVRRRIDESLPR